jgi:hypothetical protein
MSPGILKSIALLIVFPMLVPVFSTGSGQAQRQEGQCGSFTFSEQDSADNEGYTASQNPYIFWDEPKIMPGNQYNGSGADYPRARRRD